MRRRTRLIAGIAALCAAALAVAPANGMTAPKAPMCLGKRAKIVRGAGSQSVTGTKGNDVIVTGAGGDRVDGRGGNDRICSGPGADTVDGGLGGDDIDAGAGEDAVDGGLGTDRLGGGGGPDAIRGDRGNDIVHGGSGADQLFGELGDDTLLGEAGKDRISGGLGVDHLHGGAGSGDLLRGDGSTDSIDGGPGSDDIVSYAQAPELAGFRPHVIIRDQAPGSFFGLPSDLQPTGGVLVDLEGGMARGDGGRKDTLARVEDVVGSPFGDVLEGDPGPNVIDGGGGDDLLYSRRPVVDYATIGFNPFDPFVIPEAPDPGDVALGGSGTDNCRGFAETQSCDSSASAGTGVTTVFVNRSIDGTSVVISGGDPVNDVTVADRGGTLVVGDPGRVVATDGCSSPSPNTATCDTGGDIGSILVSTGNGDDTVDIGGSVPASAGVQIDGGEGDDHLFGGPGDDLITPGSFFGYDVMRGRGGNDAITTDLGEDIVDGGAGSDLLIDSVLCSGHTFIGGPGPDSISFARSQFGVTAEIGGTVSDLATPFSGGGRKFDFCITPDRITPSVENFEGSTKRDILTGDGGSNKLLGRAGDDLLSGGGGDDRLVGGTGADSLHGDEGYDGLFSVDGSADADVDCGPGSGRASVDDEDAKVRRCD